MNDKLKDAFVDAFAALQRAQSELTNEVCPFNGADPKSYRFGVPISEIEEALKLVARAAGVMSMGGVE